MKKIFWITLILCLVLPFCVYGIDGSKFDADNDGDVDAEDLAKFAQFYGTLRYYKDFDGDHYSDGTTLYSTSQPNNFFLESDLIATTGDCDDEEPNANPGLEENCDDNIDNNCDGQVNEGCMTCSDTIEDGGFELGTPNSSWIEASTNFGTPICNVSTCGLGGGTGPYQGEYWVWFGGVNNEVASVEQSVNIMPGANTLQFYLELPICDAYVGSYDTFLVYIDGNLVYFTDNNDIRCDVVGYQQYNVNIEAYADGKVHTIRFQGSNDSSNPTNFFVDSIKLVCE